MSTATLVLVCALFLTPVAVRDLGWHDGAAGKNGMHRPVPLRFDRSSGDCTHPAVSVRIYSHAAVATEMLNQAKQEVARIFREADVRMEWLDADPASSDGRFKIQMIIRRKPLGLTDDPHAMGTTLGNEHEDGGTAFVFHDRVLKTAHAAEQDVAQVLGYTIAHEIGHLLLPRPAHSSTGVMRAGWDGDDLRHIASRSLTFTPTQVAQIRSKLLSCCSASRFGGDGGMIGARGRARATSGLDVTAANSGAVVRVRSTDATILELLKEGAELSPTFRSLIDAIDHSTGFVYVEFGYCAFGHLNGCLLPFIAVSHGDRYLRILVTPDKNRRSHDQLLALLAHEMRHALEVLERKEVVDVATLQALYSKIGTPLTGQKGYETSAARAAGDAVLAELLAKHTTP